MTDAGLAGRSHITDRETVDFLKREQDGLAGGSSELPAGCSIVVDPEAIERPRSWSMAKAGRSTESSGGGNARKRTRLVISVDGSWDAVRLADALASGDVPDTLLAPGDLDQTGA